MKYGDFILLMFNVLYMFKLKLIVVYWEWFNNEFEMFLQEIMYMLMMVKKKFFSGELYVGLDLGIDIRCQKNSFML